MKVGVSLKLWVSVLMIIITVSGCSTPGKSAGAGAAIGVGLGGAAGLLADPGDDGSHRIRNVLIGGAIGGALGAGTGLLIGKGEEQQRQESFAQGQKAGQEEGLDRASATSKEQPKLIPAKTEARWVADQIRGNIFIPAHFEYLIIEASHWEAGK